MICPNCKAETFKITTVCDDDGKPFSFCGSCPRPEVKKVDFPAIVTGKRGRGRPKKIQNNEKFDRYKLSESEIRETRSLAPNIRTFDTPQTRARDSVNNRETAFVESYAGAGGFREKKLNGVFSRKFGHSNYRIVSDNGFKAVAESLQLKQ